MNIFQEEMVEIVVEEVITNEEYPFDSLSPERAKIIADNYLHYEDRRNNLLIIDEILNCVGFDTPKSAIKVACLFAWESVNWEVVAEEANKRLKDFTNEYFL